MNLQIESKYPIQLEKAAFLVREIEMEEITVLDIFVIQDGSAHFCLCRADIHSRRIGIGIRRWHSAHIVKECAKYDDGE